VEPQYEYQLPTATKEDKNSAQLTAEELKVCIVGGGLGTLTSFDLSCCRLLPLPACVSRFFY
jgi:hypothetical protein